MSCEAPHLRSTILRIFRMDLVPSCWGSLYICVCDPSRWASVMVSPLPLYCRGGITAYCFLWKRIVSPLAQKHLYIWIDKGELIIWYQHMWVIKSNQRQAALQQLSGPSHTASSYSVRYLPKPSYLTKTVCPAINTTIQLGTVCEVPLRDVGDVKSKWWRKWKRETQVTHQQCTANVRGNMEYGLLYCLKKIDLVLLYSSQQELLSTYVLSFTFTLQQHYSEARLRERSDRGRFFL